jgi:futalosine hydrolase
VPRTLIVTAVAAERDAVIAGRPYATGALEGLEVHRIVTAAGLVDVIVAGVGPVAAAISTGCALRHRYDLVLLAGIAGGFAPTRLAQIVIANAVVHADLGAAKADGGFISMQDLGWARTDFGVDTHLAAALAARCGALLGAILTVSTTTGSQHRADQLLSAHPEALAEAMEGAGVLQAAQQAGVPFAEIRSVSNMVGPRNSDEWQVPAALVALGAALDAVLAAPLPVTETLRALT